MSDAPPVTPEQLIQLRRLLRASDPAQRTEGEELFLQLAFDGQLRGAALSGIQLQRLDLAGVDLRGADLRDARLRWCDLSGADLRDADLRGVDLAYATLEDADLRGARTEGMTTPWARLGGTQWAGHHPLLGRQLPLLSDWLPDAPTWFRVVHSLPRWQIHNVFAGRHPLGMPLAREGEAGSCHSCRDCAHRQRDPWDHWRCQRLWEMGARGRGPRETVFRLRLNWPACMLWSTRAPAPAAGPPEPAPPAECP